MHFHYLFMFNICRCLTVGPGGAYTFVLESASFLLMCFIAWVASICLACSSKKGVPRFRYLKDHKELLETDYKPKKNCFCMCCCPAEICKY